MSRAPDKYALYESSVQSPRVTIEFIVGMYREIRGKYARFLREDFCGTFRLATEWVMRNRRNSAIGLDLDPEPLAYGRRKQLAKLDASQKKRLQIRQENVISITSPKSDLVISCNFSFFIFKDRETLIRYFRACHRSLRKDGILFLDMAGGPGMIATMKEQRTFKGPGGKKVLYVWDQKSFDPITHDANYAIHFRLPSGKWLRNMFTYDWRLWTIPEVRDCLKEAGFSETRVYWETEHEGKGTGEYLAMAHGDNAYSWIAYVVALKNS